MSWLASMPSWASGKGARTSWFTALWNQTLFRRVASTGDFSQIGLGVATVASSTAAAGVLTLPAAPYVIITGSTPLSGFASIGVGTLVKVMFSGSPPLTSGANFILPGGVNMTPVPGTPLEFFEESAGVFRCLDNFLLDSFAAAFTGSGTTGAVGGAPGGNVWAATGITTTFTPKTTGIYYVEFTASTYDSFTTTSPVMAKFGPGAATLADGSAIPTQGGTLIKTTTALATTNAALHTMSCVMSLIGGQTYTFSVYGASAVGGSHDCTISGAQTALDKCGWNGWRIA